jgi:Polyketide cyclase / dehydrase and lipid transport
MTRYARAHLEGTVHVALAPDDAFGLFTPSGERRWAEGWDPSFPAAAAVEDETEPGTVFQTRHQQNTTWVVVACEPGRSIAYANVSEDDRAALIRVTCQPDDDGTTTAHVTYDVTPLSDTGAARLAGFSERYQDYLAHWTEAIANALSQAHAGRA